MSATAPDATRPELEAQLAHPPAAGSFDEGELQGLPDPVCRYLRTSIAAGTPLARSARLGMRGSVKLGRWWIPFRARQLYAPQHGLVWTARAGGVITGFDRYTDGQGAMHWTLLGRLGVLHAQGPDLSRCVAGRAAAEALWVPTAMLPRFGVTWAAADAHHLAIYKLGGGVPWPPGEPRAHPAVGTRSRRWAPDTATPQRGVILIVSHGDGACRRRRRTVAVTIMSAR